MNPMQVLRFGDPFFEDAITNLMNASNTNPIYAPDFSPYYQECSIAEASNKSLVVVADFNPLVGFIHSRNEREPREIGYFGLPAQLISSDEISNSTLDAAMILLLQEMKNEGVPINQGRFSTDFRIEVNPMALRSRRIEKLIFSNSQVEPRFDRILKTSENPTTGYSKSVKQSLKQIEMLIEHVTEKSATQEIKSAIDNLKELHFQSAGRRTRSEASWEYQKKMIEKGTAIIVQGLFDNVVLSSAFFMRNSSSIFYAVSASSKNESPLGLSHLLIDHAVRNFGGLGVKDIWLGDQHTDSFKAISEKELNIQAFKGYFGGIIQTHLIAASRL